MKIVAGIFALFSVIAICIGMVDVFIRLEFTSSDMLLIALGSALLSAVSQNFVKD